MEIKQSTKAYETWLGRQMPLLAPDLKLKHQRMAQSAFSFLRATFYRWTQLFPQVCPELTAAPPVLGVGDLHVENFGTWRDSEGRLIWGVNDFDEACQLPYPNDLVRLAVSVQLAIMENHISCDLDAGYDALLAGYQESVNQGGQPFVLAEHHSGLRALAINELREPVGYWDKLGRWPNVAKAVPAEVRKALQQAMPEPGLAFRVVHRQAGLGSLGRRRFTALAEWRGGLIAREAKELASSAWHWQQADRAAGGLRYQEIISQAVRVADPFVRLHGQWLIRRLAPDCSRIEMAALPGIKDDLKLLHAMGRETANIHLGSRANTRQVAADLRKRPAKWLRKAAAAMAQATLADWKCWREG
jgi:hypothetical protein